jgi:hypothetical protein
LAIRFKTIGLSPADADAVVPRTNDRGESIGDSELCQHRFDARMQSFARSLGWERLSFEKSNAQT